MDELSEPATMPLKSHLALSPHTLDANATSNKDSGYRPRLAESSIDETSQEESLEYETLYFDSQGTRCEAWLLRPPGRQSVPLVLMAHGFAAEKSFGLPPFARRFVERGLTVMMFDYRHFGGSDGEPRNLVSVRRQQQDWQAALDFAATLPNIDPSRIALWGTSFSGGHALTCAEANPQIAAVVAQAPMLDIPASLRGYTIRYALQTMWHGLADLLCMATGRSPHLVPVFGTAPKFAAMNKPGCEVGYSRIIPEGANWQNSMPARGLITSLLHRPGRKAWRVNRPTLLLLQAEDKMVPRRLVHQAAARMCDVTVVSLWGDHFDVYQGGASFERAVQLEADFLERILFKSRAKPLSVQRAA